MPFDEHSMQWRAATFTEFENEQERVQQEQLAIGGSLRPSRGLGWRGFGGRRRYACSQLVSPFDIVFGSFPGWLAVAGLLQGTSCTRTNRQPRR